MGRLIYSALASLDGCIADRDGGFDWALPGDDVHAAVNARMHGVGVFLLGRRTYEVMRAWDAIDLDGLPEVVVGFARIWRSADKVVYSRTLHHVDAPRTRVERHFDVDGVRRLVPSLGRDAAIGGPDLAGAAFRAGIVDEVLLHVFPVLVGGGTPAFPEARLDLALAETRTYDRGVVGLAYRRVTT
ncbi:dihydrofolate reductase family protein [Agromyces sp. C10]|uniref:dihydrofolate reductase family protein n=1 Tax=Agromyces sp. C10 TaxID=2935077 RepID=UPI00200A1E22|nr:dihydrofolate reductase family protein [Agromyces sp. C10]MCK8608072.1 dihydrofolate reductase family protein [Agromyces sp. C10]